VGAITAAASRSHPRRRSELGLILVGVVVVLAADVLAYLGTYDRLPPNLAVAGAAMLAMGLVANLLNRLLIPEADPVVMPVILVLNGLSYVMMVRLEPSPTSSPHLAGLQSIWSVVGLVGYGATLVVFRRSRDLERYRYLLAAFAFLLLLLPLVPGLKDYAADQNGAYLWVKLGPISFQPIEFSKILLVIFFASYFVEKRELLSMATTRIGDRLVPDLRGFGPVALAWAASVGVIVLERDIGFSLILFVVFLTMLWVTTGRWTYILLGIVAFALGTFVAAHILAQVNERIEVWLDPWKYLSTYGYQPAIGEVMMGRGGTTGTGLGLGGAPYIPVAQSDYIFAAIGNELGLAGTAAIVVAFMLLAGAGVRIATRARSDFAKLAALGFTVVLAFQSFVIMAGVTRLLPLTGVTLPFVSYGGSSLVANYIMIALLLRISHEGAQPVLTEPPHLVTRRRYSPAGA
jgi:cell division protein FtsW (lipid II flippase)